MKRKFDILQMMNIEVEKKHKEDIKQKPKNLKVEVPHTLPCQICGIPVKEYAKCTSPYVYCSLDCLEVIVLSEKNDYLDECSNKTFKKVQSEDDLTIYDD